MWVGVTNGARTVKLDLSKLGTEHRAERLETREDYRRVFEQIKTLYQSNITNENHPHGVALTEYEFDKIGFWIALGEEIISDLTREIV